VVASQRSGESPEHVGDDPEIGRCGGGYGIEGLFVAPGPGRHRHGAFGANGVAKGLYQSERPSLDRPGGPKGAVYQQDTAQLDAKGTQLIGYFGPAQDNHGY
jgi:hypothetical protein